MVRGWSSIKDLSKVVQTGRSISLTYSKGEIAPEAGLNELINFVVNHSEVKGTNRRIQILGRRPVRTNAERQFISVARLTYLKRQLMDAGVPANSIVQTILETADGNIDAPISVNLNSFEEKSLFFAAQPKRD